MAISNHERVGRALNLLKEGLYPYIEREMKSVYKVWLPEKTAVLIPETLSAAIKMI